MDKIDWDKLTCRETTGFDEKKNNYTYCGGSAYAIVLHYKDQKAYPMCFMCTDHNVRNRGGVLIAKKEKT